jgi:hypothetical protein
MIPALSRSLQPIRERLGDLADLPNHLNHTVSIELVKKSLRNRISPKTYVNQRGLPHQPFFASELEIADVDLTAVAKPLDYFRMCWRDRAIRQRLATQPGSVATSAQAVSRW